MSETLAAIVVSRGTRDATLRCVRSLLERGAAPGCEVRVVVVDNASSDGTVAALESEHADRIDICALARNAGFAAACNFAASRAPDAAWLLFLNADAEVTAGAIAALVAALRPADEFSVAGPRFTFPDGRPQPSLRGHPTPAALLYQHTAARFLRIGRSAYARYKEPPRPEVTLGACLLVRGSAFRALGGFDERYFLYFEEADLERRAQERGGAIVHVPQAHVIHEGGASSDRDRERALTWYLTSLFRYVDRFHGRAKGLAYRAVFKPLFLVKMATDGVRDVLVLLFRGRREKRAELALFGRFLLRGMWTFLFA
jgi:GT2 family glycosyltransferase